jgi:hypothetical protein
MAKIKRKNVDLRRHALAVSCGLGRNHVSVMLAAAAILLLFGSFLVLRAVIEADTHDLRTTALPAEQPGATREHRRAA